MDVLRLKAESVGQLTLILIGICLLDRGTVKVPLTKQAASFDVQGGQPGNVGMGWGRVRILKLTLSGLEEIGKFSSSGPVGWNKPAPLYPYRPVA